MTIKIIAAALLAATAFTGAHAALTVETTDFIGAYTNYNGFEGLGFTSTYPGAYTEQGITVEKIGNISYFGTNIQTIVGVANWYSVGTGYIRITFGGTINAVEMLVGSGWFSAAGDLQYDVLKAGTSIGTGSVCCVPNYLSGANFFGFSGAAFDEVRIQAQQSGATSFDANAFEALDIDAINFNGYAAAVPEPASWTLMIAGFGMIGSAMRRRKAVAA